MKNEKQLFEIPSLTSLEGDMVSLDSLNDLNSVYSFCEYGCDFGCAKGQPTPPEYK